MSDCQGCGGKRSVADIPVGGWDPFYDPRPDDRGIYMLTTDVVECEPYHGAFTGASIYAVGLGVEGKERLFLRAQRQEAIDYAIANELLMTHRSVVQFCHDPIFTLIGA